MGNEKKDTVGVCKVGVEEDAREGRALLDLSDVLCFWVIYWNFIAVCLLIGRDTHRPKDLSIIK